MFGEIKSGLFVDAPLSDCIESLAAWSNSWRVARDFKIVDTNVSNPLAFIGQRDFNPYRAVLTDSERWTGFFDNHARFFCPAAEKHNLCRLLRTEAMFLLCDQDSEIPVTSFEYSSPSDGDPEVVNRSVSVECDSGWTFQQFGEPLWFENLDAYQQHLRRDRLTLDHLQEYARTLGIPLSLTELGSINVLVEWDNHM